MSSLGGWWRLWLALTVCACIAAGGWAYANPDLYANEREMGSNLKVSTKTMFLSQEKEFPEGVGYKVDDCVHGTLRVKTESVRDVFGELYENKPEGPHAELVARCTSFEKVGISLGMAVASSLAILLAAIAVMWVVAGFNKRSGG